MRTAFIVETEEDAPSWEDGTWLTGRFEGHVEDGFGIRDSFDDLPLDEALAWARARAEQVMLRHGDLPDRYLSVAHEDPAGLPELVRRRHPDDRWRNRTDADPPIAWRVDATLVPPGAEGLPLEEVRRRRDGWRDAVSRAGADAWDSDPLDEWLRDTTAAYRRSRGGEVGWFSYGFVALHAEVTVEAPNAARAEAAVTLRLPPGWTATLSARPA